MYKPGATSSSIRPELSFRSPIRAARTPYSYNVPRDRFDLTCSTPRARGREASSTRRSSAPGSDRVA
jgi:hypothetical protein